MIRLLKGMITCYEKWLVAQIADVPGKSPQKDGK
jgi:hypothetical protein